MSNTEKYSVRDCHRSQRFIVTVEFEGTRYKILQLVFRKTDGSLYVGFPYFAESTGIVSLITWMRDKPPPANLGLEPGGKVTSHLVKYSHHPDGRAHFSQDGKVFTKIWKQSVPLDDLRGHIFTAQVQGLMSFERIHSGKDNRAPNRKKTVLNFSFGSEETEAIKIVARLYPRSVIMKNRLSGALGPMMHAVTPTGKTYTAFLCSSPIGHAGEDRVLVITCEKVPMLDKTGEPCLTFIAGFDSPSIINDLSKATTFLALAYPVRNANELAERIGSIDLKSLAE